MFPLDKSDFIRTRLTHSLEVASIARSLGQNITSALLKSGRDPEFTPEMQGRVCDLLQSAGLIHDIGNPPFGHFGEETIREWFQNHLKDLVYEGKSADEQLTEQQKLDFLRFEGNAQGLRMAARLDYPYNDAGMNLTYGLLSSMIKYPASSMEAAPDSPDIRKKKNGYFASEQELFERIAEETGTGSSRNPLAFILEAADDIAYAAADIEDAFKKGFFSFEKLTEEFRERGTAKTYLLRLTDRYDFARLQGTVLPEEYAVRSWLREMQDVLLIAATEGFLEHYDEIMEGSFSREIICGRNESRMLRVLKSTAYDYAFTSMSIFKTEIAANRILNALLDILIPSACTLDGENAGIMDEKYLSLIPESYKQICRKSSDGKCASERLYARMQMGMDTVSGMTDSYAKDLYSELTGIH